MPASPVDPTHGQAESTTPYRIRRQVARALSGPGLHVWVPGGDAAVSCLARVARYPSHVDSGTNTQPLRLTATRGEEVRCQIAVLHTDGLRDLVASVSAPAGAGGTLPAHANWVAYHPVVQDLCDKPRWARFADTHAPHEVSGDGSPDVIADALPPATHPVRVPPYAAQPVWVTVAVPPQATAGHYTGHVTLSAAEGTQVNLSLHVEVLPVDLPPISRGDFQLDVWFSPDAVAAAHTVEPWSARHWELIARYLGAQARLGQRGIAVAVVDNPWLAKELLDTPWLATDPDRCSQTATGRTSSVTWTWDGRAWSFDFHLFDRLVRAADHAGLGPVVTAYSMLAFNGPQRLTYRDARTGDLALEEVELGDERWRQAWAAFLSAFEAHLRRSGWLDRVWLGFDERPPEQLRVTRALVEAVAPAFATRIAVAGTDRVLPLADDACVAWGDLARVTPDIVARRRADGKLTSFYTCCVEDHPNCLTWSPAVESRMIPWLAAARGLDGYLRWAFNDWPEQVWTDPLYRFPQGDEYLVYPGDDGPCTSIRWELLHQGIQDVAVLRLARDRLGHDHPLLRAAEQLAVRQPDGRVKDVRDLVHARQLLHQALHTDDDRRRPDLAQRVGGLHRNKGVNTDGAVDER